MKPRRFNPINSEHARGTVAHGAAAWQRVFGNHRVAADKRVGADAAELVHGRSRADVDVVRDQDVAAERRVRAEDGVAADAAIVCDVHVIHEQIAIADAGDTATAGSAAMDGDEFAEDVAGADLQPCRSPCI